MLDIIYNKRNINCPALYIKGVIIWQSTHFVTSNGPLDLERSKTFYGGLFAWKFEPWGEDYLTFTAPESPGGGEHYLLKCLINLGESNDWF